MTPLAGGIRGGTAFACRATKPLNPNGWRLAQKPSFASTATKWRKRHKRLSLTTLFQYKKNPDPHSKASERTLDFKKRVGKNYSNSYSLENHRPPYRRRRSSPRRYSRKKG